MNYNDLTPEERDLLQREVDRARDQARWTQNKKLSTEETEFLKAGKKDYPEEFKYDNGQYQSKCMVCKSYFIGMKRRKICKECYLEIKEAYEESN